MSLTFPNKRSAAFGLDFAEGSSVSNFDLKNMTRNEDMANMKVINFNEEVLNADRFGFALFHMTITDQPTEFLLRQKLVEINTFIDKLIQKMSNDTLLIVTGNPGAQL